MKIVITSKARTDIHEIDAYIAQDDRRRARSFVRGLLRSAHELHEMALAFPLIPGHEHHGIRRRIHGRYLIFYRVHANRIEVLRFLNGAQNYPAILFPEDESPTV